MPLVAQINRLGDFVGRDKRRLFWGVFAAFVVGVVGSTLYTIWLGYHMGAYNFQPNWLIIYEGEWQYGMTVNEILNPARMEAIDYWFLLIGAGTMVIVNLMRYRFARWPVHPIGFALSGLPAARRMGSTLLVAWLTKLIMLRGGRGGVLPAVDALFPGHARRVHHRRDGGDAGGRDLVSESGARRPQSGIDWRDGRALF